MNRTTYAKRLQRSARRPLQLESLEDRTAPANLAIADAYFLGAGGERMDSPTIGARSRFQVEFTQEGVPAGRQYTVSLSVYGLVTESFQITSATAGAVTLTATTDTAYLIDPGPVPTFVHLDVGDVIPETNPNDNDQTFTFTPSAFTAAEGKFTQPLAGTPLVNWFINNYVDLDPDPGKTEIEDYHGGEQTYDGHDALDIPIGGWEAMDLGVPVRAAASGVVVDLDDGHPDRNQIDLDSDENPPVNFLTINHGNGWVTSYLHLRTNSVAVKIGDVVKPGDIIGLVGSSGRSSGPHLHFAVRHYGLTVETYMDPAAYWFDPAPYTENTPDVFPSDAQTYFIVEKAETATVFLTDPSGLSVPQFVTYTTFENGAESNVDYDHTAGAELVFLPTPVTIPINHDGQIETAEDLLVKVQNLDTGDADWLTVQIVDDDFPIHFDVGSSRVDLQACKLEYSIVSPK